MALLLLSGIERNPGPFSNDSVSSVSTIQDENIIKDKFSIVHYNVQSISNKIDLLESELMNFALYVLLKLGWIIGLRMIF